MAGPATHHRGDGRAIEEGKTTSRALGRLAAMNGEHVVIVDCDIRQPSFGTHAEHPGLVDCLREQATTAEVIRKDKATGVDWIASGHGEANALGLLMSAAMA